MPDRRPRRITALLESMSAAGVDALLLTSLPNIRYLTGFSGTSALVLVRPGRLHFITDFRYQTQVDAEVGSLAELRVEPQSLWNGLWQMMGQQQGLQMIGFESAHLLHRDFQRLLESGGRWQWRPTVDLVETLREQKDPDEVALIREAAGVATRALGCVLERIRPGMTELAVAGMLEHALRDEGSEGFPFATIVASGPRSALPHARSARRVIESGDLLLLDFGAEVGGYCADITRTVVVGSADSLQREVYEIVRTANQRAAASMRPGMKGRDADAVARSYIADRGYGESFGHSLGHGVGLEVHEAPRLARTSDGVVAANAVVTIEPGIYRPGWGGVRIEDDVHVAPDGPIVLSNFTRDLIEIGC